MTTEAAGGALVLAPMVAADVPEVADLHAASWQATYAGILDDAYLAGPVLADRRSCWSKRFGTSPDAVDTSAHVGIVARLDGRMVGFVYAIARAHAGRGTLVENLHAAPGLHGQGIGSALLAALGETLEAMGHPGGVWLEAFAKNTAACRYYQRIGASLVERFVEDLPGGGTGDSVILAWPDLAALRRGLQR